MEADSEGTARALNRAEPGRRWSDDSTTIQWQQDRVKNIEPSKASRICVDGADELWSVDTRASIMPNKKTPPTSTQSSYHFRAKPCEEHVKARLTDGRKLSSPPKTKKHPKDIALMPTSLTALDKYEHGTSKCSSRSEVESLVEEASYEVRSSWPQSDNQAHEAKHQRRKCGPRKRPLSMALSEESKPSGGDGQVNSATNPLGNALHPVTSSETGPSSEAGLSHSESALEETSNESSMFIEALRVTATDRRASVTSSMNKSNISVSSNTKTNLCLPNCEANATMDSSVPEYRTSLLIGPSVPPPRVQLKLRGGTIMGSKRPPDYNQSKSNKVIEAYKTALQVLENAVGRNSTAYVTPYGNPQDNYVTPYGDPQEKHVKPYADPQHKYVTPYGPPETSLDPSAKSNEVKSSNGFNSRPIMPEVAVPDANTKEHHGTDEASTGHASSPGNQDHDIDHAQVDRLLLLAGGGSLTNDEDTDDEVEFLASFPKAQQDEEVQARFMHIYDVMAGNGQSGKDQAENLRNIMNQADVTKNLIIPKEQSHATSRLYATLASRVQGPSRPGGSILPHGLNSIGPSLLFNSPGLFQATTPPQYPSMHDRGFPYYVGNYGDNVPPPIHGNFSGTFIPHIVGNQRGYLVPHHPDIYGQPVPRNNLAFTAPAPVVQQRPFVPASIPPPPIPSRVGTARGKTAEEAKKVRDYGFPPLPSSRPGMRIPTKRKLEE